MSSFLTAHQHIKGYFVPSNDRSDYSELAVQIVLIRFFCIHCCLLMSAMFRVKILKKNANQMMSTITANNDGVWLIYVHWKSISNLIFYSY